MTNYQLVEKFEQCDSLDMPVIQTVAFGDGKKYLVTKNNIPYLIAKVDEISKYFDKACIFGKYLCIGTGSRVIFVNLESLGSISMQVNFYFGYFFIHENILYIASGTGITAVSSTLQTIWKNEDLAIDGVIIHEVFTQDNQKFLRISCEMDPPDNWTEKLVNI
ncbi:MAG: hypothetical protein K2G88_08300, partial [Oscillospiraceae bacterium]|nr:hypothetical protein [Oscillospiraceae bacterium]